MNEPAAVVAGLTIAGVGLSYGGYFPSTWGWTALGLAWVAAVTLAIRTDIHIGPLDLAFLGALSVTTVWSALSGLWSAALPQTVLEVERTLMYVTAVVAMLLLVRSRAASRLLGGVLAGVVVVVGYGLCARLFPERIPQIEDDIGGFRLDDPIGYWNALGIVAVFGILLAIGFATRGRTIVARSAGAAAVVVLVAPLYFTFGRGPWIALAVGLAALVTFDPRRLQVLTLLAFLVPAPALAVWIASRSGPLTERGAAVAEVARDGERFAVVVAALALVSGTVVAAFAYVERRVRIPRAAARAWAAALALVAVAALVAVFVRYGGPVTLAQKGYDSFKSPPVGVAEGEGGTKRLFTLSSNGRLDMWDAAWGDFQAHPLLGSGAGTYEQYWLEHRATPMKVRDAHSLYFETLAELGPFGLVALISALAVPVVAALRARQRRLVPAALAAYAAVLVHAGADWDWEIPAVMLPALFCAAALVVAARPSWPAWPIRSFARAGGIAALLAVAAAALVAAVGNSALRESEHALFEDFDAERALLEARRATRWAPWSSDALQWRGRAELALGRERDAQASFRAALRKDPRDWELWLDLGYALHEDGSAKVAAVRRAFELNPLAPELELAFADDELGVPRGAVDGG